MNYITKLKTNPILRNVLLRISFWILFMLIVSYLMQFNSIDSAFRFFIMIAALALTLIIAFWSYNYTAEHLPHLYGGYKNLPQNYPEEKHGVMIYVMLFTVFGGLIINEIDRSLNFPIFMIIPLATVLWLSYFDITIKQYASRKEGLRQLYGITWYFIFRMGMYIFFPH